jgi:hypothetical protein
MIVKNKSDVISNKCDKKKYTEESILFDKKSLMNKKLNRF